MMEQKSLGTVIAVYKQWWLKINTKAFRRTALDGAIFPHVIRVKYTVNGEEYTKLKWISAGVKPPKIDSFLTVAYDESNPKRAKIIFEQERRY